MERILILTSYDHVYNYAMANLLKNNKCVEVIQRTSTNELLLSKLAKEFKPSKLIVNKILFSEFAYGIIESMAVVPEMKLFILNEYENTFQIVTQKVLEIRTGQDLVKEVLSKKENLEAGA